MLRIPGRLAMLLLRLQPCWPLERSTSTAWLELPGSPSQMAPLSEMWSACEVSKQAS